MRVLVVSDIHGNWEALRTVAAAERADCVICLGDIVDYGPHPAETVRWVREHATVAVRGNHDTAVALGVPCRSAPAFRRLSEESRRLTVPMLSGDADLVLVGHTHLPVVLDLGGRTMVEPRCAASGASRRPERRTT
jgi:putative phosphoesterase